MAERLELMDILTPEKFGRIERAKEWLPGTDQSCTEIGFQAGCTNQSYFTRTFQSLVGMTPRLFRARNRREGSTVVDG